MATKNGTKNGTKKKPTARSTKSTPELVEEETEVKTRRRKIIPFEDTVPSEGEVKTRRSRPTPPPETNQDSDESKRKYVGVMSLWCNEKWKEIQETRNLEPDDAGMSSSIRPTEAQILIDELQLGIDEKRNTQMYLMANKYKDKESHPDFKLSILVDPDYANECYDKIKNSGSVGVAQSRRSRSGGSTRRYR